MSIQHPARRLGLRFGIRAVLFFMVAVAVPLAWRVNQVSSQRRAVVEIESIGGQVTRFYPWGPRWLHAIVGEEFFSDVDTVTLRDVDRTWYGPRESETDEPLLDEHLRVIAWCPWVRSVEIRSSRVSDEGMRHLASAHSITDLTIAGSSTIGYGRENYLPSSVTAEGVAHLARLPNLRILTFDGSLPPESFACLSSLTELSIHVSQLDRIGSLEGLVNLKSLTLTCDTETTSRPFDRLDEIGRNLGLQHIHFAVWCIDSWSETWNPQLGRYRMLSEAERFKSESYHPTWPPPQRVSGVVGFSD